MQKYDVETRKLVQFNPTHAFMVSKKDNWVKDDMKKHPLCNRAKKSHHMSLNL
jgi:hypothetical protein